MTGISRAASIARMEQDGTMDARRKELRAWFEEHPLASPADAVAELGYTFADHMAAVADSVWMDMWREAGLERVALAWGDDYEDIRYESGRCRARRRRWDGREITAATPDELNAAIRADWALREDPS